MTALLGGLRALGISEGAHGVFTARPAQLTNDFFVNLLAMRTAWKPTAHTGVWQGVDRANGAARWTGTTVDLVFGSNSQLRALAEVYASADGEARFRQDFVAAWVQMMEADRFDLSRPPASRVATVKPS